jgi:hypothetical protein
MTSSVAAGLQAHIEDVMYQRHGAEEDGDFSISSPNEKDDVCHGSQSTMHNLDGGRHLSEKSIGRCAANKL